MNRSKLVAHVGALAAILFVAACTDDPTMMDPTQPSLAAHGPQGVGAQFARANPEVMAIPGTVFGAHDEAAGVMVFGVENQGVVRGVQNALSRMGVSQDAYEIQVTEPIHFAATLRDRHRPTMSGLQIHWSNYVCTLGFSVDHAAGRSMITNSHCTNNQGSTGTTAYYQPASSVDGSPIATEAHDPAYFKGGACSRGKVCRYSDSSRALYASGVASNAEIAKTTGVNSGSLEISGSFAIASQNNTSTTFSGTVQKVGRTTGWTSGGVTQTCATVNVSGTNIQLLCQTLVENSSATIVQGGDSGSPVFTGSTSATLIGILWGGNSSGSLFVFSPLKSIQDELGSMNATTNGVGGDGGGDDGGGDDGGDTCVPKGPNGNNCK